MALLPSPVDIPTVLSSFSSGAPLRFWFNRREARFRLTFRGVGVSCAGETEQLNSPRVKLVTVTSKSKRKLRPSFHEQIREKWSVKIDSPRQKFPWQEERKEEEEVRDEVRSRVVEVAPRGVGRAESLTKPVIGVFASNRRVLAPWVQQSEPGKAQISPVEVFSEDEEEEFKVQSTVRIGDFIKDSENESEARAEDQAVSYYDGKLENTELSEEDYGFRGEKGSDVDGALCYEDAEEAEDFDGRRDIAKSVLVEFNYAVDRVYKEEVEELVGAVAGAPLVDLGDANESKETEDSTDVFRSVELPWMSKRDREGTEKENGVKSNTRLAEKLIPEHELKRLRNISLRMMERISVGPAGITQGVVDAVHKKWRTDEVVKLKFEGPSSVNMKRIHEGLERRTGGLVIWRSGGSIVLYRGMSYKLPCVQSYRDQGRSESSNDAHFGVGQNVAQNDFEAASIPLMSSKSKYIDNLSKEELMDMSELNLLLDGLGPRFYDWSGPEPLPVDADSLPSFVPGYRPPFRLLPYGAKRCVGNKQMTSIRRIARSMPPHFALGMQS